MARKNRQNRRALETQALRLVRRGNPRAGLRILADAGLGQPARTQFLTHRVGLPETEARQVA